MVDEIGGLGSGRLDRLTRGGKARSGRAEGKDEEQPAAEGAELEVSSQMRALLERVKQAETFRKGRVHEVLEKLQRGELVTSEAVREAAEQILRGGV